MNAKEAWELSDDEFIEWLDTVDGVAWLAENPLDSPVEPDTGWDDGRLLGVFGLLLICGVLGLFVLSTIFALIHAATFDPAETPRPLTSEVNRGTLSP